MFNKDFYPTPANIIETMLSGENIQNKTILEPSAGKGDIIDYLNANGAKTVLACEINPDLSKIIKSKCNVIGDDFLKLQGHQISHINLIVMNPPFSADEKHILHAFEIAPAGCRIIALCNLRTVDNPHTKERAKLAQIIEQNGGFEDLGSCFDTAERKTGAEIALIKITKPGTSYEQEFNGFFMDEDPQEAQENALMSYNVVRDLVQRYTEAIKIFDKQLEEAVRMNSLTSGFFSSHIGMSITQGDQQTTRNQFKKDLQKSGWNFIFEKMNMQKYATKGLREDINKFVETQEKISFTMKNIYAMLEIVAGTTSQRMDKALLEVFDKLTMHYDENRYNVEGWKTNSHYLINQKFILPRMCEANKYDNGMKINTSWGSYFETVDDMLKALCYLTGDNYDNFLSLYSATRNEHIVKYGNKLEGFSSDIHYSGAFERIKELEKQGIKATYEYEPKIYGEWYDWGYFRVKAYKKGTMHFEFKDADLWGRFNQRIAKLKGFPLYEYKETKHSKKADQETAKHYRPAKKANVLFEIDIKS